MRGSWMAMVLVGVTALVGCVGCDDGPDITKPAEEVGDATAAEIAEFCEVLTSEQEFAQQEFAQREFAPTSRAGADDAANFLVGLLAVTPDGLRDEVTRLRDAAVALADARTDAEAERIAREELDPGVFAAYAKIDGFRRDGCR